MHTVEMKMMHCCFTFIYFATFLVACEYKRSVPQNVSIVKQIMIFGGCARRIRTKHEVMAEVLSRF